MVYALVYMILLQVVLGVLAYHRDKTGGDEHPVYRKLCYMTLEIKMLLSYSLALIRDT